MTAVAAVAVMAATLFLGRRDVTRPAVAFGVVWFGCVALAQLRLTELETPWSTRFTLLVFAGGLCFMLAATLAGGTGGARGTVGIRAGEYRPRRLVGAAVVLFAGGTAGLAYKTHVLGGIPLLSGRADELRSGAVQNGEVVIPAWSSALTDGFFLAMWCALAALWILRGRLSRLQAAGLWLLAAVALFAVALPASRNTVLLAGLVPLVALYLIARPGQRAARVGIAATAMLVVVVVGGLFVARLAESNPHSDDFLDRETARQPTAVRPLVPFYINGVYPLQAASRLYEAVPRRQPYTLGGASLTSLPDAAFPEGKQHLGGAVAEMMRSPESDGLAWSVATYQGRLFADAGWAGVVLGSLLLGLGFGALYRWARSRAGFVAVALVGYLAYYSAFMAYDNLLSFTVIAVYDLAAIAAIDLYARRKT